jgi:non-specific serine/threonine protein kinase
MAGTLLNLGAVVAMQGEHGRAAALYQESLALSRIMGNMETVSDCLEGLARAMWGLGQPVRTAWLLGAAAAGRATLGTLRVPTDQAAYDRSVTEVRAALGEETFAATWVRGQNMTLEQAVAYALADGAR